MHRFQNDYSEGAHPLILDALIRTNEEQCVGYTCDHHCQHARELILDACGLTGDEADVAFIPGGTATNVIALRGLLERPYDSVICTPDGHINTHETGALELTGSKIIPTADTNGHVSVSEVEKIVRANAAFGNHMTRPRVVYVSDSTELGGLYHKEELAELSVWAHAHDMKLFLDGARLGSALTAPGNDLTLNDVAQLCDAFYLGGTKNGLMFGEALVMRDPQLRHDVAWLMKQHANLMAKGRLMGVQFEAAFTDNLYWSCAQNANKTAAQLFAGLESQGWHAWWPCESNQIFFEVSPDVAHALGDALGCEEFFDLGATKVVRFVTSWATTAAHVEEALAYTQTLAQQQL